jgi:hypothetical protein
MKNFFLSSFFSLKESPMRKTIDQIDTMDDINLINMNMYSTSECEGNTGIQLCPTQDSFFSAPFSGMFPTLGIGTRSEYVRNVNWSQMKQTRAGIIPYCNIHGTRYFNLGIDGRYRQYTDYGGRRDDRDLNPLRVALRELSEESLYVFGRIPQDILDKGLVIYDLDMIIIFIDVTNIISGQTLSGISQRFEQKRANAKYSKHKELSSLAWLDEGTFKWLIDFPKKTMVNPISQQPLEFYNMVQNFLYRSGDFYANL